MTSKHAYLTFLCSISYDVIINGREEQILQRFLDFDANVIFSAESYCWPDATLEVN